MIDLIIVYLTLIVIILLFIIAFLTIYIIDEHRKRSIRSLNDNSIVLPLINLKTNVNHSNSTKSKRPLHRIRNQSSNVFICAQNSQGFLLSNDDLTLHNKRVSQHQAIIHFNR